MVQTVVVNRVANPEYFFMQKEGELNACRLSGHIIVEVHDSHKHIPAIQQFL
jgi:hypothetical protein